MNRIRRFLRTLPLLIIGGAVIEGTWANKNHKQPSNLADNWGKKCSGSDCDQIPKKPYVYVALGRLTAGCYCSEVDQLDKDNIMYSLCQFHEKRYNIKDLDVTENNKNYKIEFTFTHENLKESITEGSLCKDFLQQMRNR